MVIITNKEGEALLLIFKDFSINYNANSISKKLNVSSRGALKILKKLYQEKLLISKEFGNAIFYKTNYNDKYAEKLVETLLIKESREKANRWIDEFKEIYDNIQIAIVFGSIVKDYNNASDIDLLLVFKKEKYKNVIKLLDKKKQVLSKPVHDINLTLSDLKKNLKNNNLAIINAIKKGYVLYGQDKIVEVMKHVTSF